jgi:hypothetical protein
MCLTVVPVPLRQRLRTSLSTSLPSRLVVRLMALVLVGSLAVVLPLNKLTRGKDES